MDNTDGLNICPQLSSSLNLVQIEVNYLGMPLTIRISKQNTPIICQNTISEQQLSIDLLIGILLFLLNNYAYFKINNYRKF